MSFLAFLVLYVCSKSKQFHFRFIHVVRWLVVRVQFQYIPFLLSFRYSTQTFFDDWQLFSMLLLLICYFLFWYLVPFIVWIAYFHRTQTNGTDTRSIYKPKIRACAHFCLLLLLFSVFYIFLVALSVDIRHIISYQLILFSFPFPKAYDYLVA